MTEPATPCPFCSEFASGLGVAPPRFGRRLIRDQWRTRSVRLLPTLGPLHQGHMLLVPTAHHTSFASLPQLSTQEMLAAYQASRKFLEHHFGPTVAFEHGSSLASTSGGCGIVHAHMHFVPVPEYLYAQGPPQTADCEWRTVTAEDWLCEIGEVQRATGSYLYYESANGRRYATGVDAVESQFMRRWLSTLLQTHHWDWTVSPGAERVEATIRWMATAGPPDGFIDHTMKGTVQASGKAVTS